MEVGKTNVEITLVNESGGAHFSVWFPINSREGTGIAASFTGLKDLLRLAKESYTPTSGHWTTLFDNARHLVVRLNESTLKGGFRSDRPLYEEFIAEVLRMYSARKELAEFLTELSEKDTDEVLKQYHEFMAESMGGYMASHPQASHAEAYSHAKKLQSKEQSESLVELDKARLRYQQYHKFMIKAIRKYKAANPQEGHAEAYEAARDQYLGVI